MRPSLKHPPRAPLSRSPCHWRTQPRLCRSYQGLLRRRRPYLPGRWCQCHRASELWPPRRRRHGCPSSVPRSERQLVPFVNRGNRMAPFYNPLLSQSGDNPRPPLEGRLPCGRLLSRPSAWQRRILHQRHSGRCGSGRRGNRHHHRRHVRYVRQQMLRALLQYVHHRTQSMNGVELQRRVLLRRRDQRDDHRPDRANGVTAPSARSPCPVGRVRHADIPPLEGSQSCATVRAPV